MRGRLARRSDERDHCVRRHVRAHGADRLRLRQQNADGLAHALLHSDGRLFELHTGTHDGDHEVALGRPLVHDMRQKVKERRRRVLGVLQRPCIVGEHGQAVEQDGLAELLLGREVAIERPHANTRLLHDQVDGDLYPLEREEVLGGVENASPIALGVGPQGACGGLGDRVVTPCPYFAVTPTEIPLSPVDKRNSGSV